MLYCVRFTHYLPPRAQGSQRSDVKNLLILSRCSAKRLGALCGLKFVLVNLLCSSDVISRQVYLQNAINKGGVWVFKALFTTEGAAEFFKLVVASS
jgi:hypothetical protein